MYVRLFLTVKHIRDRRNSLTREYGLRALRVRRQIVKEKPNSCEFLGPITICISVIRLPAAPRQEKQSVGETIRCGWEDMGLIPSLENIPSSDALFLLFIRYRGKIAAI